MACQCAPALLQLRKEINAKWPDRDKASDGCCASSAHTSQNPTSDHEPGAKGATDGYAHALDIDENLSDAIDSLAFLVPVLLADSRTKYVIYEGQIHYPPATTKPYTGINAHKQHLHVSIKGTATFETRPWLKPAPIEEDDMPLTIEEIGAIATSSANAVMDRLNAEGTAFGLEGFGNTVKHTVELGRLNANSLAVLLSRDGEVSAADIAKAIPDGLAQAVADELAERLKD